ncbi:MAG: hypothetical protein US49_C0003G0048 [candidate division TM6 bacterium GW2011_GWF2_37_49]|nr:MAG: hypothetical protein US49_C0003G0048 [candidate division TM6 bacterium GW2011_GWF2_37_49]
MLDFVKNILKFIVIFLILDGCVYFNANPKKLTNVSGDKYLYLKYVPIADRFSNVYKFQLVLMPRKEDATDLNIELVDMKDEKGNLVEKTVFGSRGRYMMANIKTPDNKYLVFYYPDNAYPITTTQGSDLHIQALDKIPSDMPKYTWLIFHHYQLDQYFFQPVLNDFWYLQRMQHKAINGLPVVDVLPYEGTPESTGRYFIFWKLED